MCREKDNESEQVEPVPEGSQPIDSSSNRNSSGTKNDGIVVETMLEAVNWDKEDTKLLQKDKVSET